MTRRLGATGPHARGKGDTERLRSMKPGDEWWEPRRDPPKSATGKTRPSTREAGLYVVAKRLGILIEITRHRAIANLSDEVTHLIRVRFVCHVMEA